jgi:hypothetical protein
MTQTAQKSGQISFVQVEYGNKKKQTRRGIFLPLIDLFVSSINCHKVIMCKHH